MFKADNRKITSRRKICLKLTIMTSERNCKNKSITANKYMFIVHQKRNLNKVLGINKSQKKLTIKKL